MEMLGVFAIFAGMAFCAVLGGIAAIVLSIIVLYLFDVITNDNLGQMIVRRVRIWLRNMWANSDSFSFFREINIVFNEAREPKEEIKNGKYFKRKEF